MRRERYKRTSVPGLGQSVTSTWHRQGPRQSEAAIVSPPPVGEREAKAVVAPATKD